MHPLPLSVFALASLCLTAVGQGAVLGPCYEPAFGTNLGLGDDDVAPSQALGFSFPGPGGTATSSIHVSSNGFVWLAPSLDAGGQCNETKFLQFGPRIAVLWADLMPEPTFGGGVWFNSFPAAGSVPARAVVTWDGMRDYGIVGGRRWTIQLQMFADGSVSMFYDGSYAMIVALPAIVGITAGNGGVPGNGTDLSAYATTPYDSGTQSSAYEFFQSDLFDLARAVWSYVPNGQGGYHVTSRSGCTFASSAPFGYGCPRPASFFETFGGTLTGGGGSFDLANTALEFVPFGSGGYFASPSTGLWTGYSGNLGMQHNQVLQLALPFPFVFPGGSTSTIGISSNGFVWLQAGVPNPRGFGGYDAGFLADPPSIAPLWAYLDPSQAGPGGGVFFDVQGQTAAHVTWVDLPDPLAPSNRATFQLTLRSDGSFRMAWGDVTGSSLDMVVGLSQGGATVIDVLPTDLGTANFSTPGFGTPLHLDAQPFEQPRLGRSFAMDVTDATPGSLFGIMMFGTALLYPTGMDLSGLGMTGCTLHGTADTLASFPLSGSQASFSFFVPPTPTLQGLAFVAQAATYTPTANAFGLVTSNGLSLELGY